MLLIANNSRKRKEAKAAGLDNTTILKPSFVCYLALLVWRSGRVKPSCYSCTRRVKLRDGCLLERRDVEWLVFLGHLLITTGLYCGLLEGSKQ
mmetsp:Transcript_2743/g.5873  ORF Transcript_2743/g.5873 Transcript_2743/m.5873 type:complete len:93 (+) Transcript_2743:1388-1666(+)